MDVFGLAMSILASNGTTRHCFFRIPAIPPVFPRSLYLFPLFFCAATMRAQLQWCGCDTPRRRNSAFKPVGKRNVNPEIEYTALSVQKSLRLQSSHCRVLLLVILLIWLSSQLLCLSHWLILLFALCLMHHCWCITAPWSLTLHGHFKRKHIQYVDCVSFSFINNYVNKSDLV